MHICCVSIIPVADFCANRADYVRTCRIRNNDAGDETGSKEIMELIQLNRRHISEVARLEGLRDVHAHGAGVAAPRAASVGTCAV